MLTAGLRSAVGLQQNAPRRTNRATMTKSLQWCLVASITPKAYAQHCGHSTLVPVLAITAAATPACGLEVTTLGSMYPPPPCSRLDPILYAIMLVWLWGFLIGTVFGWLIKSWLDVVSLAPATGEPTDIAMSTQPETVQSAVPPGCLNLNGLTCDELRVLLRTRGLSTTGVKADLTTRLATHLSTKLK